MATGCARWVAAGGADGGVDLPLIRDGETTVVQAKHWRSPAADDVDILLVYPDDHLDQVHALAESIRNLPARDFDVLALSSTEERELAFVQSERAVRIWPPAK